MHLYKARADTIYLRDSGGRIIGELHAGRDDVPPSRVRLRKDGGEEYEIAAVEPATDMVRLKSLRDEVLTSEQSMAERSRWYPVSELDARVEQR